MNYTFFYVVFFFFFFYNLQNSSVKDGRKVRASNRFRWIGEIEINLAKKRVVTLAKAPRRRLGGIKLDAISWSFSKCFSEISFLYIKNSQNLGRKKANSARGGEVRKQVFSLSYKKINESEMPDLNYQKKEGRKDAEYDEEQGRSL